MNYTTLRKRTYVIPGETPSQKNNQTFNTKTRTIFKSEQFRKWFDRAYPEIIRQGVPEKPYEYARIVILFRHDSLRVRDGDNQLSAIQDLLKRTKVIADDCWTRIGTPVVEHDVSAFAECVIKVMEITPIDWSRKLREEKSKNLFSARGNLNTEQ